MPNDIILTLRQIFKQLARALLQGKALSVEDMADVLSLKDNDTTIDDYATALHLLARADVS
jgi:nuclear pore complex protein Nup133